jgi:hypothetical protein
VIRAEIARDAFGLRPRLFAVVAERRRSRHRRTTRREATNCASRCCR